ncbi:TolC family protein [Paludisphaera rhizosphaerae]|uniref:TolC family protein n=1 Tax=Paludisphaera rhizosphaerae TaxID=2711216 RepID=UPI0013EC5FEC|nr:TolC family protein [Paludisphaera rhizosphaerae]
MFNRVGRSLFAATAFLTGPAATLCAAQTPEAAAPTSAQLDAMPSTVSPAIARFLRENGDRAIPDSAPRPAVSPTPVSAVEQPPSLTQEPLPAPALPDAPPVPASVYPDPSNPLATGMELKAAPFDANDVRFPINLAAALRLSDARPLIVAAAQAGVWVAEAQLTRAKVLWVPSALAGFDYTRHDGGGPDFNKGIMTAPSVNYFMAGAAGGLYVNLTDAIFEPLAARQALNAAHWNVQAAKNDALLQTSDAYFRAHQYRGMFAGALYTVDRGHQLIRLIDNLSAELVPKDEVDRARNLVADLEQRAVLARQEWRVAGADLTQVLRLDPRAVLDLQEHDHAQITLIDPGRSLDELMSIALANRPELSSRRADVLAAEIRIRREKMRPALPLVTLNGFQHPGFTLQAGVFGLGPNSSMNQWKGRADVSLQMIWQFEGLGLGNMARVKQQRGNESAAIVELRRRQDEVAADVMRAMARVQSAAARVHQADRALRTGIIAFNGHLEGLGQTRRFGDVLVLTFRPQEAVFSLNLLSKAFKEYFSTVAEYNRSQFDLFHALGYPANELTLLKQPGDPVPVNVDRPAYLPAVGHGPPPATR